VAKTFEAACVGGLNLVAQTAGEENVEFFFSLTTGLNSGHGSLAPTELTICGNKAARRTLARNVANLSCMTSNDQKSYNTAYQRTCIAPALTICHLPLPSFQKRFRTPAAEVMAAFKLLREALAAYPTRRLGTVGQMRRAPLSTHPVPMPVSHGYQLDPSEMDCAVEVVGEDEDPVASRLDEAEQAVEGDAGLQHELPGLYAGTLVVLYPGDRRSGAFWLAIVQDTPSAGATHVTVRFCETEASVHAKPPSTILYELGVIGSVPYTAILGKADQNAVHVEDETTVVITRDMYDAYSQLGNQARRGRTLDSTRRQAEDNATARENDQERAELYRPHRTTAERKATSAKRPSRGN